LDADKPLDLADLDDVAEELLLRLGDTRKHRALEQAL
jgi:hypothetical protein